MSKRGLAILFAVVCIKAALMAAFISHTPIRLAPDEAQYWTWSKALDVGYYSKPPGIAYQMALTTALLGNSELGVRGAALLFAFLLPLIVYRMSRSCGLSDRSALWAGLVMALCPMGILASLLATTDGGFILFWTIALWELVEALREDRAPHFWRVGLWVLLGALFKWPMYWFWGVVAAGCLFYPRWRCSALLKGAVLSVAALFAPLYWNWQHDWPTFRHVGSTLVAPQGNSGNPLEFFGAQLALFFPVFFVVWWVAAFRVWRRRGVEAPPLLFCTVLSVAIVLLHLGIAFGKKMQGNWCVFAYPPAAVVVGSLAESVRFRRWLFGGALLSVLTVTLGLALPSLQQHGYWVGVPYKMNPWRHALGWEKLDVALSQAGWVPGEEYLVADKYQTASLLSLYNRSRQRAYFLNFHGRRRNQFSYWPQMANEQQGRNGYFVWVENVDRIEGSLGELVSRYETLLGEYFAEVSFAGAHPLWEVAGRAEKIALLFRCEGYNGRCPESATSY